MRLQGPPKIRSRRNARFCLCKPRPESQIAISEECIPIHGNCISRNSPFAFARSTLRLRLRFDSWQVLTDATSTPCMRPPVLYTARGTEQYRARTFNIAHENLITRTDNSRGHILRRCVVRKDAVYAVAVVHLWQSYVPTLVKDVGFYRHVLSALRQGRYVHAPFFCFLLSLLFSLLCHAAGIVPSHLGCAPCNKACAREPPLSTPLPHTGPSPSSSPSTSGPANFFLCYYQQH